MSTPSPIGKRFVRMVSFSDMTTGLRDADGRTKVFDYEIPIKVDGEPATVLGTLYWVGSGSASKLPFILVGVAIIAAALAATLIARRRRPAIDDQQPAVSDRDGGW